MVLHDLPLELQYLVFRCADRDDLPALARVSKRFNTLVTPLLYYAVSVPSLDHLLSFDRTLEQKPELATHIHHLLVSDRMKNSYEVQFPDFIVDSNSSQDVPPHLAKKLRVREWLKRRDLDFCQFHIALRRVLFLVCTHVRSLTLLHFEKSIRSMRDILLFDYRKLEELTIRGDYPSLPREIQMPNLRRLHLAAGDMPNPWTTFDILTARCPHLTHLRITEPLSCVLSDTLLTHAFEMTFGVAPCDMHALVFDMDLTGYDGEGLASIAPPRLPLSLTHFFVQPHPPEHDEEGEPLTDYKKMLERLGALARLSSILRIVPAVGDRQALPYECKLAMEHWLDRVEGGEGCWAGTS